MNFIYNSLHLNMIVFENILKSLNLK